MVKGLIESAGVLVTVHSDGGGAEVGHGGVEQAVSSRPGYGDTKIESSMKSEEIKVVSYDKYWSVSFSRVFWIRNASQ